MKALVVGGTGPTGLFLVNGLIQRGYEVAILHRGTHELDEMPEEVEHIHVDPHFRETLADGLEGRYFDVVIATYGRIRLVAEALIGKTPRLIAVGGTPSIRGMVVPDSSFPPGMPIPAQESAARIESKEELGFGYLIRQTEDVVLQGQKEGHYEATVFRYPLVYGPNEISSFEWLIMKRIQDKRREVILPEGGLSIVSRGYGENMAHAVLLAVDQPSQSAGKIYHCADEQQLSLAQWVQVIAATMDWEFDIVGVPDEVAYTAREFFPIGTSAYHQMMDISQLKSDLGYKDIVPALEALPRTVEWLLKYKPTNDGKFDKRKDPLQYATEDAQIAIQKEARERLRTVEHRVKSTRHNYAHPKEPSLEKDHRNR
ncbi:MAG: hypothetical protein KUG82_04650 [Pseudomonadales bacterium]|nr:hypothetical protein [Pseudomonadales bacterium]